VIGGGRGHWNVGGAYWAARPLWGNGLEGDDVVVAGEVGHLQVADPHAALGLHDEEFGAGVLASETRGLAGRLAKGAVPEFGGRWPSGFQTMKKLSGKAIVSIPPVHALRGIGQRVVQLS
jgi:hypothetical protein